MKTQLRMLKMYAASGVFVLALVAQPALAQNRRASTTNQPNSNATTMPQSGTASGSELGNYRYPPADQLIPLEESKRQVINTDLQATVVELLELYHDAKQSHWNLRGPLYLPLHEQLQKYADLYRSYADILAERQLSIGMSTDGRTETIVQSANLPKFPGGPLADRQVLEIMTERINTIAKRVRQRIDSTSKNGDDVSSNKLQDLSYELDKQVWQFRVHMQ